MCRLAPLVRPPSALKWIGAASPGVRAHSAREGLGCGMGDTRGPTLLLPQGLERRALFFRL